MTDPGRTKGQVPLCLWRWGLTLCALLALTSCSGPETGPVPEPEEPPRAEAVEPQEAPAAGPEEELSADGLPLVIPLEAQELEPPALEAGGPGGGPGLGGRGVFGPAGLRRGAGDPPGQPGPGQRDHLLRCLRPHPDFGRGLDRPGPPVGV